MKLIIFITIFVVVGGTANVKKLPVINGTVKFLEIDSKGVSYVATNIKTNYLDENYFYVLNSNNDVIFTQKFDYVLSLVFNKKEELYLSVCKLEASKYRIEIFKFDRNDVVVKQQIKYYMDYFNNGYFFMAFFVDDNNNLLFNKNDGVHVLREGDDKPIKIANLDSYYIKNSKTIAAGDNGNIYIGVCGKKPEIEDKIAVISEDELRKSNPSAYFVNVHVFGLHSVVAFKDSIYFGSKNSIIRLKNDSHYILKHWELASNFSVSLIPVNNRLYVHYVDIQLADLNPMLQNLTYYYGQFYYLTPDYTMHSIGQLKLLTFRHCYDKNGTFFFGGSLSPPEDGGIVYYIKSDESRLSILNVPNNFHIYGLAATESGDLWILSETLYVIPRNTGNTDIPEYGMYPVKIGGLPYVVNWWPIKAKPGTGEVLIGSENGVYVAKFLKN